MAHEDRMIPIGYVAEARLNAWAESHANFQMALTDEEVKEYIQDVRLYLIEWAHESESLEDVLMSYIGENEEDFSMLARHYLARRFVDAIANGIIFEGKYQFEVESETILYKEWLCQMVGECAEEIKKRVAADVAKMQAITLAIFGGFGRRMSEAGSSSDESGDDDTPQSDAGCVKPPYSM